eukprot:CAMPEP_0175083136 /NCGR_PEP_ID=MMETSP0052_2-20121109/27176_1 /TAXON_ID=51329 ORGANISM="Polytomella parva, Strain SAG 63-3" /NCGR_SAMPLE_ID=MMETSP0052_2 /ASSEMBLY_ACC=CAM_ASM_000194 /LENGTH=910 /DNA_ID=CAMNT_0016354475 /DNA_START=498 /DNA_END=3227 /DNA_ORIENTATION=-
MKGRKLWLQETIAKHANSSVVTQHQDQPQKVVGTDPCTGGKQSSPPRDGFDGKNEDVEDIESIQITCKSQDGNDLIGVPQLSAEGKGNQGVHTAKMAAIEASNYRHVFGIKHSFPPPPADPCRCPLEQDAFASFNASEGVDDGDGSSQHTSIPPPPSPSSSSRPSNERQNRIQMSDAAPVAVSSLDCLEGISFTCTSAALAVLAEEAEGVHNPSHPTAQVAPSQHASLASPFAASTSRPPSVASASASPVPLAITQSGSILSRLSNYMLVHDAFNELGHVTNDEDDRASHASSNGDHRSDGNLVASMNSIELMGMNSPNRKAKGARNNHSVSNGNLNLNSRSNNSHHGIPYEDSFLTENLLLHDTVGPEHETVGHVSSSPKAFRKVSLGSFHSPLDFLRDRAVQSSPYKHLDSNSRSNQHSPLLPYDHAIRDGTALLQDGLRSDALANSDGKMRDCHRSSQPNDQAHRSASVQSILDSMDRNNDYNSGNYNRNGSNNNNSYNNNAGKTGPPSNFNNMLQSASLPSFASHHPPRLGVSISSSGLTRLDLARTPDMDLNGAGFGSGFSGKTTFLKSDGSNDSDAGSNSCWIERRSKWRQKFNRRPGLLTNGLKGRGVVSLNGARTDFEKELLQKSRGGDFSTLRKPRDKEGQDKVEKDKMEREKMESSSRKELSSTHYYGIENEYRIASSYSSNGAASNTAGGTSRSRNALPQLENAPSQSTSAINNKTINSANAINVSGEKKQIHKPLKTPLLELDDLNLHSDYSDDNNKNDKRSSCKDDGGDEVGSNDKDADDNGDNGDNGDNNKYLTKDDDGLYKDNSSHQRKSCSKSGDEPYSSSIPITNTTTPTTPMTTTTTLSGIPLPAHASATQGGVSVLDPQRPLLVPYRMHQAIRLTPPPLLMRSIGASGSVG